jgi:hypothetical protein
VYIYTSIAETKYFLLLVNVTFVSLHRLPLHKCLDHVVDTAEGLVTIQQQCDVLLTLNGRATFGGVGNTCDNLSG